MNLAVILFSGGLVVILWIVAWNYLLSRQNQTNENDTTIDSDIKATLAKIPGGMSHNDAVLISRGHGQLIFANDSAKNWLGLNGETPHLEQIARVTAPSDSFLELFASERQSSFQFGKRWVEASSHQIASKQETRTVVVMRELSTATAHPDALDLNMTMNIINEIGETVNASMGVNQVLQTILSVLGGAIDFEAGEISLWEADTQTLIQRGWVGDAMYMISLAEAGGGYYLGEGISGWIAEHRKPVLIADRNDPIAIQPKLQEINYQSFLAIPLSLGDRFLGTIEFAHTKKNHYTRGHLALLQAISKPVSVAIYNAEIYAEQMQRIDDIASIQQLSAKNDGFLSNTETIYSSLNQRIAELMSASMCGVLLYDELTERLIPELPFHGLPDPLVQSLTIPLPKGSPQYDIWERQTDWVSSDVPDEPLVKALGLESIVSVAGIINTAWMPLEISGHRIGVIAVSNKQDGVGFTTRDIQHLRILTAQASIVVENIRLFQREQRIDAELVGLQEITHAIGALSHEGEFYSEITERIGRLMGIQYCGILLYDKASSYLVSKLPFYGLADDAVQDYKIYIEPNSVFEELWTDEDYWYENRVQTNTLVYASGLDSLADKLGIQKTLIASLQVGGEKIGVVQVSNKLNGEDFNERDARQLLIFATQAAAIIENARLYQEVNRRADEAQSLRRVAELAGAVLTAEENFAPLLREIASLTNSEVVFINVLNQQTGSLVTYPRYVHGIELNEPVIQDLFSENFHQSVALSQESFVSNDVVGDSRTIESYRNVAQRIGISKVVVAPLLVGDRALGEMGIANRQDGNYDQSDLSMLVVIASQIASAMERLLLYEQTGENLNRRIDELDSISRVTAELATTFDLDRVLTVIISEAIQATNADNGTVALVQPYAQGSGKLMMDRRIGNVEIIGDLADVEIEAAKLATDIVSIRDYEFSTLTPKPQTAHSALAAPIVYLNEVVGVLHIYHDEVNRFDDRAAAFLTTLATKAALGYGNHIRFTDQATRNNHMQRRVSQLNRLFELGHMSHNTNPTEVLEAIAYSVQGSIGFDTVVMTKLDEETNLIRRVAHAGIPLTEFEQTRDYTISEDQLHKLLKPDYQIGEDTFFLPAEKVGDWYQEDVKALSTIYDGNRTIELTGDGGWQDGDMLLVRLRGATGKMVGVMSLDRPHDNRRVERDTVEVLEIFAHQAATTIETITLFLDSKQSAEEETLLNEIVEQASQSLDVNEILLATATGIHRLVNYDYFTVALVNENNTNQFNLTHYVISAEGKASVVDAQVSDLNQTVMGYSFTENEVAHYHKESAEAIAYKDLQDWIAQGEIASLIIPLSTGGQSLGVIHVGINAKRNADALKTADPMIRRFIRWVSGAIQNARLFNQAINLQTLNRSVVESIEQGIVVLNASGQILSSNNFMSNRYDWDSSAVGQNLFAYDNKLAEFLTEPVENALKNGALGELINQTSLKDDGTVLNRNFYIYPLRAADKTQGAVILVEDVTDRAQLENQMEARANQLSALTDASTRITSSLERGEVITLALEEMGWLIAHDMMTVWRRNGSYMVLEGKGGLDGQENLEEDNTRILFSEYELVRQMVDTQRVVAVGRDTDQPQAIPHHENSQSWMGIPLVNQGHVVGMVVLTDDEPNVYEGTSDQNVAFAFASQVAIALANAELFEQTFARTNELGTLLEAAQATSFTQDLESVFKTVVELMFSALDMDDCAIMIWDDVDNALEVQVDMNRNGDVDRISPKGTRFDLSKYNAKLQALRDRDVIVVTHDNENNPYTSEVEELRQHGDTARMLVPLVVRDQSIGLIQLEQQSEDNAITQQKVRLAKALGAQVAVAIENARLSAEMSSQYGELMLINELSRSISSTLDLNDMMDIIADQVTEVTDSDELYLALYNDETQEITFPLAVRSRGKERFEIPSRNLNTDEVSFIISKRRPLNLGADYFSPDELRNSLGITNGEGEAKSYLGMPIIASDRVYGVLALRDTERTRAFNVTDHRILEIVSSQVGAAIQNARLFLQINNFNADLEKQVLQRTEELEDERDRIDTLYQITSELARSLDMDRLLQRGLGMIAKAVGAQDGLIALPDPITDQLYSRAMLDPSAMIVDEDAERAYHPAEVLGQWLWDEGDQAVTIDDLHEFEGWDKTQAGAEKWRSALAVSLETNDDPQGVLILVHDQPNAFNEAQSRMVIAAGNQIASAVNNADLYQIIRDNAERLGVLLRTEQEEAERNATILEGITDGVILADADGKIVRFNVAAERILGIPEEQALGEDVAKLTGIYGFEAATWVQNPREIPIEGDHQFINEQLKLDDKIVNVHLAPVYNNETFLGTVSVFRDITREIESAQSKNKFVENVSHEFRTPLTPIKGYIDLVLMGASGEVNDGQRRILNTVKQNVDRLAQLVEDVLRVAHIDSGRDLLRPEALHLNKEITDILAEIESSGAHESKNLTVNFTAESDEMTIEADRAKLNQILTNIIDNAFNYTPADGNIDIHAQTQADGKEILISVKDSGVGIPEDFHEDVWQRFTRHDETALTLDVSGTGLGLPIVKDLVEMHKGQVSFESEVGVGTTFYITLPAQQSLTQLKSVSTAAGGD